MGLVRPRASGTAGRSRSFRAVAVAAAALTGFGGAAAVDALAAPPIAVADDFGAGDGLTRYVVTAATGDATPDFLAALEEQDGVASAQRLFDGTALVAAEGLTAQQLRAAPGVTEVEYSTSVPVQGTASDPYYASYAWHLENSGSNAYGQFPVKADADIDGSQAWDASTGAGIIVAVADTGYDSDHPDLAGALWTNPAERCGSVDVDGNGLAGDCHGWNFTTNSPDVDNGSGGTHGTNVSGAIGARKDNGAGLTGVAPDVTIMPLAIGSGGGIDVNLGAQAIRYAADHGASVVNASWGGTVTGTALTNLRAAVSYAAAKGVLVVAAAGNDSGNRDTSIVYPASLTEANVVTVGASTASDTVSDFSGYGATSVDLFAPGTQVASTWNDGGYRLVSGTSIAAPLVTGALALYRDTMPTASIADLKARLLGDVDRLPAFTGRSVSGGRLNVSHLDPSGAVSYQFSAMSGTTGVLSPHVRASGPDGSGTYEVTVGLGMEYGDEVWALADTPVTLGGTTGTTDDAGQVTFPLGALDTVEGLELSPTVDLAAGRYALSVQLRKDGAALGGTRAAPLLVADVVAPGSGSGGTPGSGTGTGTGPSTGSGTGSGTAPGTGTGTTPRTGTGPGTGSGTTPGTGTGSGPGTGTGSGSGTTPGTGTRSGTTPGTGSGPAPGPGSGTGSGPGTGTGTGTGTGPGTGSTPGTTPGTGTGSNPGTGTGAGTSPGSGTGTGSTPGTGTRSGSTPGTGTNPGSGPGTPSSPVVNYPGVGPFGLTSISPSVVSVSGGTRVTITGTKIPAGARVRVGASRAATVLSSTSTSIVFTAPAVVAGAYDVHVFDAAGTSSSVLSGGLTYVDGGTAPGGSGTGGGSAAGPGTGGGSGASGTEGTDGSAGPTTASGPRGQRLVRSAAFGKLGASFWSLDCRTSCRGVVV